MEREVILKIVKDRGQMPDTKKLSKETEAQHALRVKRKLAVFENFVNELVKSREMYEHNYELMKDASKIAPKSKDHLFYCYVENLINEKSRYYMEKLGISIKTSVDSKKLFKKWRT